MNEELLLIKKKFIAANYPIKFVESIFIRFKQKDNNINTKEHIAIPNLSEVSKSAILFWTPFCSSYNQFIKRFHQFTNNIFYKLIDDIFYEILELIGQPGKWELFFN